MGTNYDLRFEHENNELSNTLEIAFGAIKYGTHEPHWVCTQTEARKILSVLRECGFIDPDTHVTFSSQHCQELVQDYTVLASKIMSHPLEYREPVDRSHRYQILNRHSRGGNALSGRFVGFLNDHGRGRYTFESFAHAFRLMMEAVKQEWIKAHTAIDLLQQVIASGVPITDPPQIMEVRVYQQNH